MCDSHSLLSALFHIGLRDRNLSHFPMLPGVRSALVFVVLLATEVPIVCSPAEERHLQLVLVVVLALERCF